MKLKEYNFRDIDKRIVKLSNNDIASKFNLNIPYYGVIYIDHIKGISLRIVKDNNNDYMIGEGYILRYDDIKDIELEFIEEIDNIDLINKWLDNYYNDEAIINTRDIKDIDSFRYESNPDIISITFNKDSKKEVIWARILGYTKEALVCGIINDSKLYNLDIGTVVAVNYDDNNEISVIGRVDL